MAQIESIRLIFPYGLRDNRTIIKQNDQFFFDCLTRSEKIMYTIEDGEWVIGGKEMIFFVQVKNLQDALV